MGLNAGNSALFLSLATSVAFFSAPVSADEIEDFYSGNQLQMIIPFSPGGAYDSYGRLVAENITRHIPGNPSVVVQNMPGAGGLLAAQHMADIAPQDGTVLIMMSQGLALVQAAGPQEERDQMNLDLSDFNWIGNLSDSNQLVVTWHTSPVQTMEDALTQEAIMGSTGAGSASANVPLLLNSLLGTQFDVLMGYEGSSQIDLAMESGEVDGRSANTWASWNSNHPDWIADDRLNILLQIGREREADLPDVPLATEMTSNPLDLGAMNVMTNVSELGRPLATSPGVPAERMEALRGAFVAMVADPEFQAQAEQQNLEVSTMDGETVQQLVLEIVQAPEEALAHLRSAMQD